MVWYWQSKAALNRIRTLRNECIHLRIVRIAYLMPLVIIVSLELSIVHFLSWLQAKIILLQKYEYGKSYTNYCMQSDKHAFLCTYTKMHFH